MAKRTKNGKWEVRKSEFQVVASYEIVNLVKEEWGLFPGGKLYMAHVVRLWWKGPYAIRYFRVSRGEGNWGNLTPLRELHCSGKPSREKVLWGFARFAKGGAR